MSVQAVRNVNHKPRWRRQLPLLSIALLFLATMHASRANAQIVGDLEAKIPFQFHAGNAKLPAGTYRIHVLDDSDLTVMEIISEDGATSALFQVQESESKSVPAQSELVFNKYGDRYFLANLFDEGNPIGTKVIESKYEKKVSQQAVTAQEHVPLRRRTQQGN